MESTVASVNDSNFGPLAEEQQLHLSSMDDDLQLLTPLKKQRGSKRRLMAGLSSDEEESVGTELANSSSPKRSRLLASVLQTPPGTPVSNPFSKIDKTAKNAIWKKDVVRVSVALHKS